jgi:hypothetical protein
MWFTASEAEGRRKVKRARVNMIDFGRPLVWLTTELCTASATCRRSAKGLCDHQNEINRYLRNLNIRKGRVSRG